MQGGDAEVTIGGPGGDIVTSGGGAETCKLSRVNLDQTQTSVLVGGFRREKI